MNSTPILALQYPLRMKESETKPLSLIVVIIFYKLHVFYLLNVLSIRYGIYSIIFIEQKKALFCSLLAF